LNHLKIAFVLTTAVIILTMAIIVPVSIAVLIGLGLAAWLVTTSLTHFIRRGGRHSDLPMTIAHAGMGIAVAGMIGTSLWVEEKSVMMKQGERVTVGRYELTLDKVEAGFGPNYSTIQASLTARIMGSNAEPFTLTPERRHYPVAATRTTEAAIRKTWRDDIYVVLGQPAEDGKADSWVIRASTHPLVPALWLGLLLVAIGGAMGVLQQMRKGQTA
jgi:cytochrome c-type biogenesis protein CcmF